MDVDEDSNQNLDLDLLDISKEASVRNYAINVLAYLLLVVKAVIKLFSCSTQLSMIDCQSKLRLNVEK